MRSEVRFFPGPFFYESQDTSDDFGPGDVAQLGERWLCKPEVAGSTPVVSIKFASSEFNALCSFTEAGQNSLKSQYAGAVI